LRTAVTSLISVTLTPKPAAFMRSTHAPQQPQDELLKTCTSEGMEAA
jgi:hypothetical protein